MSREAPTALPRAWWVKPTHNWARPCHSSRSSSGHDFHRTSRASCAAKGRPSSSRLRAYASVASGDRGSSEMGSTPVAPYGRGRPSASRGRACCAFPCSFRSRSPPTSALCGHRVKRDGVGTTTGGQHGHLRVVAHNSDKCLVLHGYPFPGDLSSPTEALRHPLSHDTGPRDSLGTAPRRPFDIGPHRTPVPVASPTLTERPVARPSDATAFPLAAECGGPLAKRVAHRGLRPVDAVTAQ
jgi:hypothetical protein